MKHALKSGFILLLTIAVACFALPAFAQADDGGAADMDDVQLTEAPTAEPAPVTSEPVTLVPATPIPSTPEPTPPPTEAPTPEPTPEPTEDAGSVNLHMYVYTAGDLPASGYTVWMDEQNATTSGAGLADFPNLGVAQHSVRITSPDGDECEGRLYMSRSGSTRLTDQAMGGTYGVDVERGVGELFMLVTFVPGEAMTIRTLSNSQPALPQPPAEEPTQSLRPEQSVKALTATFLDEDGQPLAGLGVMVRADDGTTLENTTDARGEISIPQVPYGHYAVSAASDTSPASNFELTIQPAPKTGIAQNAGTSFVVNSSTGANHLYLEFRRAGSLFTLTEASDSPIGGMSSMMLGIIVVAVVIVIVIIVLVVVSRRKKRTVAGPPPRKTNYNPVKEPDDDDSLRPDLPRRTGGANKFDDRSRM